MTTSMLSQSELKRAFTYDEKTGVFKRLAPLAGRVVGDVAGTTKKDGYISITIKGKLYQAHRLAWLYVNGEFPNKDLDHIDCNKSNNCITNLRECTPSENQCNKKILKKSISGFKGVSWCKSAGKWQAQAGLNGKSHYLGVFGTPEEASDAYQTFAQKNHGKFYRSPA